MEVEIIKMEKMTKKNQEIWNKFYREKNKFLYCPSEDLTAFFNTYLENNLYSKKVLDIGCGAGRNLLLAGKLGAEIYGVDSSQEAIKESQRFLTQEGLNPHLEVGNVTNLSYLDNFFDVSILWGIFHYLSGSDQRKTRKEIERVSKDNSWVVFTLRSIHDSRYRIGKEVEKDTFIQDKPGRENIFIKYWNEDDARKFFNLENILIGEKIRAPIGRLGIKSAHWMIAGRIKKNG
jgi:ubiquinone/menaquinone biosynthesis C-methylase UbiE